MYRIVGKCIVAALVDVKLFETLVQKSPFTNKAIKNRYVWTDLSLSRFVVLEYCTTGAATLSA